MAEKFGMARRNMLLRSAEDLGVLEGALQECSLAIKSISIEQVGANMEVPYRQVRDAIAAMYDKKLPGGTDERRAIAHAIDDMASWASRTFWSEGR